jgi:polar amino acid transport system substrate-binding protein
MRVFEEIGRKAAFYLGSIHEAVRRAIGVAGAARPFLAALAMLVSPSAQAESYKVSVGKIPATPILLEILKSIEAANPGVSLEISVVPFPRSLKAVVEDHTADCHYPYIRPVDESALPFDISTANTFRSPFMIYENKNKPLDVKNLKQYKIETDIGHTGVFPFPTIGSGDIASSLRKVDAGRIDGFIFDELSTDEQLVAGNFKNIHRTPYAWVETGFVLPKGAKGGPVDQALSKMMENATNNQGYKDAIAKLQAMNKGDDWQQ